MTTNASNIVLLTYVHPGPVFKGTKRKSEEAVPSQNDMPCFSTFVCTEHRAEPLDYKGRRKIVALEVWWSRLMVKFVWTGFASISPL